MNRLVAVLVVIGVVAAVVLRWRKPETVSYAWTRAKGATSSLAETVADKAANGTSAAADNVEGAFIH